MTRSRVGRWSQPHHSINLQRLIILLAAGVLLAIAILWLSAAVALAQENAAEITPSFGDGKLKILGTGFKPNENVTITVKSDQACVGKPRENFFRAVYFLCVGCEVGTFGS